MRFLRPEDVPEGDVERTFRHSPLAALVIHLWFLAPAVALVWRFDLALEAARALPVWAWIVVGPIALLAVALAWLVLSATRAVVHASLLRSNWLVKCARDGLYVQLRSHLNHHFPPDVPTVLQLGLDEVASVRRIVESHMTGSGEDRGRVRKTWIELELRGVDTAPLAAWLDAEATRKGPDTRTLGVRSSMRFRHAPVVVPRPGAVRIERVRRALWRELAARFPVARDAEVALDDAATGSLETRVGRLVARGETIAAVELAREERRLSLAQAKSLVDSLRAAGSAESRR